MAQGGRRRTGPLTGGPLTGGPLTGGARPGTGSAGPGAGRGSWSTAPGRAEGPGGRPVPERGPVPGGRPPGARRAARAFWRAGWRADAARWRPGAPGRGGAVSAPARGRAQVSRPRRSSSGSMRGSRPRKSRKASIASSLPPRDSRVAAEVVAVLARQAAVLLEPLDAVGVEHLAPDVGVVAGAVAAARRCARSRWCGSAAAPARSRRRPPPAPRPRTPRRRRPASPSAELVPGLVEQRRREVLGGREALVELLGGHHLVDQLLRASARRSRGAWRSWPAPPARSPTSR